MKTRFFILYIFLIITATAVSQTGGAKGRVVNTNGIPISNANVVLENTTKGTYTKTNGFFKLSGLKTGNKVLLITHFTSSFLRFSGATVIFIAFCSNEYNNYFI